MAFETPLLEAEPNRFFKIGIAATPLALAFFFSVSNSIKYGYIHCKRLRGGQPYYTMTKPNHRAFGVNQHGQETISYRS